MRSCLLLITLCYSGCLCAQVDSSRYVAVRHSNCFARHLAVPALLVTAGIAGTTDEDIINRFEVREERNEWTPAFRTHADDYLQYTPIACMYALNAFGIRGEHDMANQTALLIKTELFMAAMVFPLKKLTAVPRPDTGDPTSFPSGHTAQAFAAATLLHKEYGKDHPLYSVLAYATATGIGTLRVLNNRHWTSDVLAGAGIGILAANLACITHQNRWGKKKKNAALLVPSYGGGQAMLHLILPLR